MKTATELKKELHEYIDSIDDEKTLMMVHEDVSIYLKKDANETSADEEDYLTPEQEAELEEAIRQADAGETMSYEEFKKKMALWHTK